MCKERLCGVDASWTSLATRRRRRCVERAALGEAGGAGSKEAGATGEGGAGIPLCLLPSTRSAPLCKVPLCKVPLLRLVRGVDAAETPKLRSVRRLGWLLIMLSESMADRRKAQCRRCGGRETLVVVVEENVVAAATHSQKRRTAVGVGVAAASSRCPLALEASRDETLAGQASCHCPCAPHLSHLEPVFA